MDHLSVSFLDALASSFGAVASLFLVSLVGFIGVRRKILSDEAINALTRLIIDVIVPARLAVSMMRGLSGETFNDAGALIFLFLVWTIGSCLIAIGVTRVWRRGSTPAGDRSIWCLSTFQNAIYVPLPLVLAILPAELESRATVYVGAAVIVMSMIMWTAGVFLLRGDEERARRVDGSWMDSMRGAFNPPVLGILTGSVLAFVPGFAEAASGGQAPALIMIPVRAADTIGAAMAPLAMILLGMMIGRVHLRKMLKVRNVLIPIVIRQVLSPLIMYVVIRWGGLGWVSPLMGLVLVIEMAAPPAVNLSVAARRYGGDWELVSSVLLVAYTVTLITLPLWTALALATLG
ncbi:AEC family transporter [bacterium]|nr:AEC family transporter [bacterium]